VLADFVAYMQEVDTPQSHRTESIPAVKELFRILGITQALKENEFLTGIIRSTAKRVNHQSKYRQIWDVGILLDHIRGVRPLHKLNGSQLATRTAAILMMFVPLRVIALTRLDPSREKASPIAGSVEVPTREKTDAKAAETWAVIRPGPDPALCPLRHYRMLKQHVRTLGVTDALFCTNAGKPFTRSDPILQRLKRLMAEAKIPPEYGANSIRHAVFTALMKKMSREEVTQFSGHSIRTQTLEKFYFHLDHNHAGQTLAAMSATGAGLVQVDPLIANVIEADDQEGQVEGEPQGSDG
jgi:hypothetical protein